MQESSGSIRTEEKHMNRRVLAPSWLLLTVLLLCVSAADAQQAKKVYRIGTWHQFAACSRPQKRLCEAVCATADTLKERTLSSSRDSQKERSTGCQDLCVI